MTSIASAVQVDMLLGLRQLLDRATRWFLANRRPPIDVPATAAQGAGAIAEVLETLPTIVRGGDADDFVARRTALVEAGVRDELAIRVVALRYGLATLSVVDIASRTGHSAGSGRRGAFCARRHPRPGSDRAADRRVAARQPLAHVGARRGT